ncbi:MAG: (2Fe-2S)-binding protein [Cytophagales bacterium]|nr:(2Fe-2S)-binding protein [Cytophagales bacterium]
MKKETTQHNEERWPEEVSQEKALLNRREFISLSSLAAAGLAAAPYVLTACDQRDPIPLSEYTEIQLVINEKEMKMKVDPRTSLLDLLREQLGLTGSKKGCNQGACGACTVHLDGMRVNSCLTLAVQADGLKVTTIEGIGTDDEFHPVQGAFLAHDGYQCGYCTSGQIMSAIMVLKENHADTREEIQEWMSGNLCRCGAYKGIVAAVEAVRDNAVPKELLVRKTS